MKRAIYPGSFDPIHEGHLRIIKKASMLFDELIVVISNNAEKSDQSNIDERYALVKDAIELENVKVIINQDKMTVDVADEVKAGWIVRSGRNNIDFKYELELAGAYKYQNKNIETIMIMPDLDAVDFKSRLIKQGVK